MTIRSVATAITMTITGAGFLGAQGPPIRVLGSNGVKAVLDELRPQCERAIGRPLAIQFNSTASLRQTIDAGEPFDVVILTSEAIDDLVQEGKIAADTRTALARCGIGIGVRAGAAKPDLSTTEALKRTLRSAKSITYAQDGASRPYIEKMFERLGVAADLKTKLALVQGSTRATASVAGGQVELVITLISEILPVRGIELAGPLPAELQNHVRFAAGVGVHAANAAAATALIQFLKGPAAAPVLRAKGLEPDR